MASDRVSKEDNSRVVVQEVAMANFEFRENVLKPLRVIAKTFYYSLTVDVLTRSKLHSSN